MRILSILHLIILSLLFPCLCAAKAKYVETPYKEQKAVFEFYFDEPHKMGPALHWLRSFIKPLNEHPYNYSAEFHNIIIVSHGTEIAVLAKKNFKKYKTTVNRLKYYVGVGVKVRICAIAMKDYGYKRSDFYDFVEIVPSAIVELSHWQSKGYSLIIPRVLDKKYSTQEIR